VEQEEEEETSEEEEEGEEPRISGYEGNPFQTVAGYKSR